MDDEQIDQQNLPESEPLQEPQQPQAIAMSKSRWQRLRNWYASHKKWAIPATVLLVLLIFAAVPWSRYKAVGIVVKKDFTIEILDSTNRSPVSGATVSAGSVSSITDGDGQVTLHLSAGNHGILISKKYYQEQRTNVLVPILSQKSTPSIAVEATGRQVKIVVKNLITQKTLGDVDIKVADITAKTDENGEAVVVLPVGTLEQKATLSLGGYNNSEATVKISSTEVLENKFNLTPAGKVYFMSKRTGKLDLMKSNLDGSEAKVVIAATGKERDYDTVLLPSPDWKYVALVARRTTAYPTPQLYILSTEDDKLLNADSGNATFTLVGWAGENLIYSVSRSDLPEWQTGKDKLKSYNANTGKITLLNQTSANGDAYISAYESYQLVLVSGENVVYGKKWWWDSSVGLSEQLIEDKKHSLSIINADGRGSKTVASYGAKTSVDFVQHSPNAIYIQQQTDESKSKFYEYVAGSAGPKTSSIDEDTYNDSYRFFYNSPSGKKSFWAEYRDGKFTLFVSNIDGSNPSSIASLSKYDAYGWDGDEYLLVTRDNTELYIMSAEGGKPVKITDFQPTAYIGY